MGKNKQKKKKQNWRIKSVTKNGKTHLPPKVIPVHNAAPAAVVGNNNAAEIIKASAGNIIQSALDGTLDTKEFLKNPFKYVHNIIGADVKKLSKPESETKAIGNGGTDK